MIMFNFTQEKRHENCHAILGFEKTQNQTQHAVLEEPALKTTPDGIVTKSWLLCMCNALQR